MLPVAALSLPATASTRTAPQNDPAPNGVDAGEFDAVLAEVPADNTSPQDAQPALPVPSGAPAHSLQSEECTPPSIDLATGGAEVAVSGIVPDATDVRAPALSAADAADMPRLDDRDDGKDDDSPAPSPALASAMQLPTSGFCPLAVGQPGIQTRAEEAQHAPENRSGSDTRQLTGASPVKTEWIDGSIAQMDAAAPMDRMQWTHSEASPKWVEQTVAGSTSAAKHPARQDGGQNGDVDARGISDAALETGDAVGIAFGALVANPSEESFPVGADGATTNRPFMTVATPVISATPAALGPEIARIIQSKAGDEVEIQLAPQELGRLRIRVAVESGATHVTVQAERPDTLDLMRRNGEVLMKELRAAGFSGGTLDFAGWSGGSHRSPSFAAPGQLPAGEDVSFTEVRVFSPGPAVRTDTGLNLRL